MIVKEALDGLNKLTEMLGENNKEMNLEDLPLNSKTFVSNTLRKMQKALFKIPK
jgi:hypothetical protein